jgi:hypothetical protein
MSHMKKKHISIRGKEVNMEELRNRNSSNVAITGNGSNIKMNANGDILKNGGVISKTRQEIDLAYNKELAGKVKRVDIRAVGADVFETPQQAIAKAKIEKEISKTPANEATAPVEEKAPSRLRKLVEKED